MATKPPERTAVKPFIKLFIRPLANLYQAGGKLLASRWQSRWQARWQTISKLSSSRFIKPSKPLERGVAAGFTCESDRRAGEPRGRQRREPV